MQIVTILRELWRLRLLVALTAIVAVIAAINVAYQVSPSSIESRKYSVGVATARILVDTPDSQVVEVAPEGSDATGVRANLLANLMVEGEIKAEIAQRAGLRTEQLEGVSKTAALPTAGSKPPNPRGYVLTTDVLSSQDGERLPIIEIEAQAPDAAKAAALANAAIKGLVGHLDSRAAADQVKSGDRLQLTPLGTPLARDVVKGPRMTMAIAAAIFFFVLGCAAILGFFALVRAWRAVDYEKLNSRLDYDFAVISGGDEPAANGNGNGNGAAHVAAEEDVLGWSFPRPEPRAASDDVTPLPERRAEPA